jgi:hypothetical protein
MTAQTSAAPALRRLIPAGPGLLPAALRLDAVVTAANGAAYLVAAGPLGDLFGMPSAALRATGAFLVVFAAAVWLVASRPDPDPTAVRAVVAANVLWVIDSIGLIAFGWWSPDTAGYVWTALQADVVALFAALQVVGLRRARR